MSVQYFDSETMLIAKCLSVIETLYTLEMNAKQQGVDLFEFIENEFGADQIAAAERIRQSAETAP